MDNQQGPSVQYKNFYSMLRGSMDGRGTGQRMDTCVCIAESLHYSETVTTLLTVYVCLCVSRSVVSDSL